ncbi:hypothetical protein EIL87_26655 [Saccharopolyspora rhizosphaerae]|uniref:Uncharacterized protein n=1 Tax=Saccharopolyspora rhizosphaerae TaxID=2492662 RepID=A0A3R8PW50_9PSEU|nr:hypothetical protein [Saccharopolyspora rhizosphaerae]RRO13212.1 hypothetical protein EIL87_26655 [Saccharopolyspora rhizosphaerae]
MGELRTTLTAPPGGVMTDEVGVITGDLELATACEDGAVQVWIRYAGANEWYRLSGADCHLHDPHDHEPLHTALAALLNRP